MARRGNGAQGGDCYVGSSATAEGHRAGRNVVRGGGGLCVLRGVWVLPEPSPKVCQES